MKLSESVLFLVVSAIWITSCSSENQKKLPNGSLEHVSLTSTGGGSGGDDSSLGNANVVDDSEEACLGAEGFPGPDDAIVDELGGDSDASDGGETDSSSGDDSDSSGGDDNSSDGGGDDGGSNDDVSDPTYDDDGNTDGSDGMADGSDSSGGDDDGGSGGNTGGPVIDLKDSRFLFSATSSNWTKGAEWSGSTVASSEPYEINERIPGHAHSFFEWWDGWTLLRLLLNIPPDPMTAFNDYFNRVDVNAISYLPNECGHSLAHAPVGVTAFVPQEAGYVYLGSQVTPDFVSIFPSKAYRYEYYWDSIDLFFDGTPELNGTGMDAFHYDCESERVYFSTSESIRTIVEGDEMILRKANLYSVTLDFTDIRAEFEGHLFPGIVNVDAAAISPAGRLLVSLNDSESCPASQAYRDDKVFERTGEKEFVEVLSGNQLGLINFEALALKEDYSHGGDSDGDTADGGDGSGSEDGGDSGGDTEGCSGEVCDPVFE